MEQEQWLNQLEASLRRAGLPVDYVLRARTELADHIGESIGSTDQTAMLDQQPTELAGELVKSFRKGGIFRRLPPAIWLLVPLLASVLMPVFYLMICEQALEFFFDLPNAAEEQADSAVTIALALFEVGKLVAPCLGIILLFLLVKRIARPWFWTAAIFLLFSFTTAATQMTLELTTWEEGEYSILVGTDQLHSMEQLPQALLIVAVGMWMVLQQRRVQSAEMELLGS